MTIPVECTHCRKTIRVPARLAGKRVKCRDCDAVLSVPAQTENGGMQHSQLMSDDDTEIIFQCPYGRLPKLMVLAGLPFLGGLGLVLFIRAFQFGLGFDIRGLPISANIVQWGIAPALMLLTGLCLLVEAEQRAHPRRIQVMVSGLKVPAGRWKRGEKTMSWVGLLAKMTSAGFMQEIALKNNAGEKARLNSMMFPSSRDFEEFLEVLSDHDVPGV